MNKQPKREIVDETDVNEMPSCAEEEADKTLYETLGDIHTIPFCMPGHKREEKNYLCGAQIDFTETDATDNLHAAKGVLYDSMRAAAKLFGVKETRFLVNGSTCGILAGLRTLTRRGDKILIARNCHKSVINAVEVLGLVPEYVLPTFFEEYGFYGSVLPEDVEKRLENTGAKVVVVTSPTYEGVISDIKSIAGICHRHGATLFVDEAHGAHLGLSKEFCKSARTLGADLVVNSVHKTLTSLTQTAVLNVCTDKVDLKRLDESLAIFETSSPSYVLMTSIDGCLREIAANRQLVDGWANTLEIVRGLLLKSDRVKLFDKSILERADRIKVFAYDKTKLVFLLNGIPYSSENLANLLLDDYNIQLEMVGENYVIAMSGLGDTTKNLIDLKNAVEDIYEHRFLNADGSVNKCSLICELPNKVFNPCEIDGLTIECADIHKCINKVSAENIYAYPPGAPIIVKGEIIDKQHVKYIDELRRSGVEISSSLKGYPKVFVVNN